MLLQVPSVRKLIDTALGSTTALLNLLLFTALLMVVAAIIARMLFKSKFDKIGCPMDHSVIPPRAVYPHPDCLPRPRHNFDTMGSSFLALFQLITGDGWHLILWVQL